MNISSPETLLGFWDAPELNPKTPTTNPPDFPVEPPMMGVTTSAESMFKAARMSLFGAWLMGMGNALWLGNLENKHNKNENQQE